MRRTTVARLVGYRHPSRTACLTRACWDCHRERHQLPTGPTRYAAHRARVASSKIDWAETRWTALLVAMLVVFVGLPILATFNLI